MSAYIVPENLFELMGTHDWRPGFSRISPLLTFEETWAAMVPRSRSFIPTLQTPLRFRVLDLDSSLGVFKIWGNCAPLCT